MDCEYTSKTLLPPQLVESWSSCTARRPQSGFPVIGSTGIFRKNRTLLGVDDIDWLAEDPSGDMPDVVPAAAPVPSDDVPALAPGPNDDVPAEPNWAVLLAPASAEALIPPVFPPTLTVTPSTSV